MPKYLLTLVFSCLLSSTAWAQSRCFEWISPENTLRIKLDIGSHMLWREVRNGVWTKSNTVQFDEQIVQDLPNDFTVHSAFYTGNSLVTLTINGMGNVYTYDFDTQKLERLDHTFYKGYNFGSSEFVRKDTLFSFGGYGFWHYTNTQTFFDRKNKEWFDYKIRNLGPETIKGGLQGYDAKTDVFYSGWGVYDPFTIGGERKNSPKFYQFDFRTRKWDYLGELNKEIHFSNNEEEVYWNGTYFIGWSTKEIYIIDPAQNKVYSSKKMDLSFNPAGKFYTKGDTLIYFFPDKRTMLRYSLKKELQDAEYIGPLYLNGIASAWYVGIAAALLALVGLGVFFSRKRSKVVHEGIFTLQEESLLKAFIKTGGLSTQDINDVLGSTNKSLDNQRRIRSITIKQINQKLFQTYGISEGIEAKADTEDKRLNIYRLKEVLAEKYLESKDLLL